MMAGTTTILAVARPELDQMWDSVWGIVQGLGMETKLYIVAGLLFVFSFAKYIWDKRRGKSTKGEMIAMILSGCVAVANIVVPILLNGIELIMWAVMTLVDTLAK